MLYSGNVIIDNVSLVRGLKHNLFTVSQFCDKGYKVLFFDETCIIYDSKKVLPSLFGKRNGNLFIADMQSRFGNEIQCFYSRASSEDS